MLDQPLSEVVYIVCARRRHHRRTPYYLRF
jgi:hypothetical protein